MMKSLFFFDRSAAFRWTGEQAMKTLLKSIQTGFGFLVHPRESVDELRTSAQTPRLAWSFLLLCLVLWTLLTAYVNLVLGQTARGRDVILNITLGPDIIVTLLTLPLGVLTVALAAFLFSTVARWLSGDSQFKLTFYLLAFTLNAGSIFFDYPHEVGWAVSTQAPWQIGEYFPGFRIYTAVVMFAPILWSLIVTVITLARLYRITLFKSLLVFLISILPIFAALIFIVM
jgi:hypothetical protein